jgi:hypothetical protein
MLGFRRRQDLGVKRREKGRETGLGQQDEPPVLGCKTVTEGRWVLGIEKGGGGWEMGPG